MKTVKHSSGYFVILSCLLVVACSSAPTRIFTLYPVTSDNSFAAYHGAPVRVDAVHIPPSLDRVEGITTLNRDELKINDDEHWAGPLGQLARQTLSLDLMSRLPPGRVISPHLAKPDGALGISVDVVDFTNDDHGARLTASWSAHPESEASLPRQGVEILNTAAGGVTAASSAGSLSLLLAQLADRIAEDLIAHQPR